MYELERPAESPDIQTLLSLPPAMARAFPSIEEAAQPGWFAACDPAGARLGSGGGTASLLAEAWRATRAHGSFSEWLRQGRKLIVHGGGQSRRLPAYAIVGKPFIPVPVLRSSFGQRLGQTLLDLQAPLYRRVLADAPAGMVAMVTSGV